MTDSSTFGLSWEQIAIAAVCLLVLVGAIYAALRGGRRRRARAKAGPVSRIHEHPGAAGAREAPSLGDPKSPVRASHMAEPRAEPVLLKTEAEPAAAPAPAAAQAPAPKADTEGLLRVQAEIAQSVKSFKGELDEMRHANVVMERRLAEAEQLIRELREAQRLLARGPRTDAPPREEPREAPRAAAKAPIPSAADSEPLLDDDEDGTMERARRAISLLRGE